MNPELQQKVIEDLERSGFGSEMRAAKVLLEAGWTVLSGANFFDRDRKRTREYDINGTLDVSRPGENDLLVEAGIRLIAEVKKSTKPWVVFKTPNLRRLQVSVMRSKPLFGDNAPPKTYSAMRSMSDPLRERLGWLGYGIHESFKNPTARSRWYSAFVKTYKAAGYEYELDENTRIAFETSKRYDPEQPTIIRFYRPVILLDGILFSAELDPNGETLLTEIDAASFDHQFRSPTADFGIFRVDVVTLAALNRYLQDWRNHVIQLADLLITLRGQAASLRS